MGRRGPKPQWVEDPFSREPIPGLVRRSDGRYVAHEDRNKTFGKETTEAIRRFRAWQSRRKGESVRIYEKREASRDVRESWEHFAEHHPDPAAREYYRRALDDPEVIYAHGVPAPEFWMKMRELLIQNPKLASQRTGIEELAYLDRLEPIETTKLSDIGDLYLADKMPPTITSKEWTNSETWFKEFLSITQARTVADLSHESFRHYREHIKNEQHERNLSKAWTRSRFGKITTIFNHALAEMNLSTRDREILSLKKLLKKPPKPKSKPVDIRRKEMTAILCEAGDFDRAMILVALNCCFNPIDIRRLRWDFIDLEKRTVCFDREKSEQLADAAVVRVAVLWQRTVDALIRIRNDPTHVFLSTLKKPIHIDTVNKRFKRVCQKAGIARNLTFTNLRDSAQTRAAELGAPMQQYQCLAGHKLPGVDDDYIRRNPNFVDEACEAIGRYYFG